MDINVNIDCADLDRMVAFYGAALGYELSGSAGDHYRAMLPIDGNGPKLVFQKVPEGKTVKNRVHLDLIVGDAMEREAARFVALGATRRSDGTVNEYGLSWIVMADPEGNELCLCDE
jgi:predicted enzyme related to lactoylglutathione lyase